MASSCCRWEVPTHVSISFLLSLPITRLLWWTILVQLPIELWKDLTKIKLSQPQLSALLFPVTHEMPDGNR